MPDDSLPRGFRFAGVYCGIKDSAEKLDLALLVSDADAVAVGVYTQNVVHAASIDWNRRITPSASARAVVVNSGNANAITGERGANDNRQMAELTASALGCRPDQCLVMSTGVIGTFLPMSAIDIGISRAASTLDGTVANWNDAARAILTTDRTTKSALRTVETSNGPIQVAGLAKGAGMIGPDMATLLAIVLTDAEMGNEQAERVMRSAVDRSFNCISVDGHTSTSDCVVLMANGQAGAGPVEAVEMAAIAGAIDEVCGELARMIPADGEGASHLVTIDISGCSDTSSARRIGKTVANSALVKTAIYGGDPNWGRIVSAAGYAGVEFDPGRVSLTLNGELVLRSGMPVKFDEAALSRSIKDEFDTHIALDFGGGEGQATFWTSDLTVDYVRFNAEYHT